MGIKEILPLKIMIVLLLFSLSACAGVERRSEDVASVKIRGVYERLVQSGLSKYPPIWCGPDTIVYRTKKFSKEAQGAFLYNLITGKKQRLGDRNYFPEACTPDGKWIFYAHKTSYNWAAGDIYQKGKAKELWRYEFATKRREKFLIVDNQEFPIDIEQQGDGYRVYSRNKPHTLIEIPEPRFEVEWSLGKRTHPVRKIIDLYRPYKSFSFLYLDNKNRMYMKVHGKENFRGYINRCDINLEKSTIKCITVSGLTHTDKPLESECAECPAESTYYSGGQIFISPDEKWIAITPVRKIGEDEGSGSDIVDMDLYVIETRKE